jgi:hypothetical protein
MRAKARLQRLVAKAKGDGGRCPACPAIALFDVAAGEEGNWPEPPTCARCGRAELAIYAVHPRQGGHGDALPEALDHPEEGNPT